jgi:CubicO group peptidase (beta-lactamase class C family)
MSTEQNDSTGADLSGFCHERFASVGEEFARNFADRAELGASVCVVHRGEIVVDLWGGFADHERTKGWQENTLVVVFSCTKGATALCAHLLASTGDLDLDVPVARYWPAFGSHAKESITTRMILTHQGFLDLAPPFRRSTSTILTSWSVAWNKNPLSGGPDDGTAITL